MASEAAELHCRELEYWNGAAGERWVRNQARLDAALAPAAHAVIERAAVAPGMKIVDIGCGCGATSIELSRRVHPGGAVLGLDVSAPMIEWASRTAPEELPVTFVLGDAAVHPFTPGSFDLLFSRFGVMFFGDPDRAFANMRSGLRPGARIAFACWRAPRENPWMMLPLQAAYEHVPPLPRPGPEDPGPFSFAGEERVRRVLGSGGFSDVALDPFDFELQLTRDGGLDQAVAFAIEVGATSRAIDGQPEQVVDAVRASIRRVLEPLQKGSAVGLAAAIWLVSAVSR